MKVSLAVLALLGTTDALKVRSELRNHAKLQTKTKAKEAEVPQPKALAQAKLNPYSAHSIMEAFDENGNGIITEEEFLGKLKDLCGGDDGDCYKDGKDKFFEADVSNHFAVNCEDTGGPLSYEEGKAFAEEKGERLPTSEELRKMIADKSQTTGDMWAPVMDEDGTKDYIQVGDIWVHYPGKSHNQYYGFPPWAE